MHLGGPEEEKQWRPAPKEGGSASAGREDLAFASVLLSSHFSPRAEGLSPGSQHSLPAGLHWAGPFP